MKKLNKFIKILVFILLFCMISDVKAMSEDEAREGNDKLLGNVLDGKTVSYISPINAEIKNVKSDFDGNYILLCKYNYYIKATGFNSTYNNHVDNTNLYYSLKPGHEGIYVVQATTDVGLYSNISSLSLFIKGTDRKVYSKDLIGIYKKKDTFEKPKDGFIFAIQNEDEIIENLVVSNQCPYFNSVYHTGGMFEGYKTWSIRGFSTNSYANDKLIKDYKNAYSKGASYTNVESKIENAYNKVYAEMGYGSADLSNSDTPLGRYYQYNLSKMQENQNCNVVNPEEDEQANKIISEVKNNFIKYVKQELITTRNNSDVTKLQLPKIITNCNDNGEGTDCISNKKNKFQGYLAFILTSFTTQAGYAKDYCKANSSQSNEVKTVRDELYECYDNNMSNFDDVCKDLENKLDDAESKQEDLYKQADAYEAEVNSYIYKNLIISSETEKPKGCAIFGQKTTALLKWAYKLIKIGAPILVVILGILDFVRALLAGDDKGFKEAWQRFIKRLIAAVVVILLPVLVTFLLDISGVLKQYGIEGEGNEIYCIFK